MFRWFVALNLRRSGTQDFMPSCFREIRHDRSESQRKDEQDAHVDGVRSRSHLAVIVLDEMIQQINWQNEHETYHDRYDHGGASLDPVF